MSILDGVKQAVNELTGEAQRQREAAQKAEQTQQAEAARKQEALKEQLAAKAQERAAAEKSRAERQNGGPGDRLAAQVVPGQEDRMREARERKPEPEKVPEAPPRVAEHNQYRPVEFIRGPSMGGGPFVNPLAYKAVQQSQQNVQEARAAGPAQQASPATPQREPTMIEKIKERQKEQPRQQPAPAQLQTQAATLNQDITR